MLLAVRPGMEIQADVRGDLRPVLVHAVMPDGLQVWPLYPPSEAGQLLRIGWNEVLLDGSWEHFTVVGPELRPVPPREALDDRDAGYLAKLEQAHRAASTAAGVVRQAAADLLDLYGDFPPGDVQEAEEALELAGRALLRLCGRLDDGRRYPEQLQDDFKPTAEERAAREAEDAAEASDRRRRRLRPDST